MHESNPQNSESKSRPEYRSTEICRFPPNSFCQPLCIFLLLVITLGASLTGLAREGRSVLDLQTWSDRTTVPVRSPSGGSISLINLDPEVSRWYVLQLKKTDGTVVESFHLENPYPETQQIELDHDGALILVEDSVRQRCDLLSGGKESLLAAGRKVKRPFVELCDGRLYLRNPTIGHKTRKEWMTDLLRDRVRFGDRITNFIKERFYRDKYRKTGLQNPQDDRITLQDELKSPVRVSVLPGAGTFDLKKMDMNFSLAAGSGDRVEPGHWYPIPGYPGIFVSVVTPEIIPDTSGGIRKGLISPPEQKETSALVYLVAFDLSMFDLAFALGTDHPRVGWSDRVPEKSRTPSLPGPDGFESIAPLVRTGKVNPRDVDRAAATFAGGFKRDHGAFKWGDLAGRNRGSHYGFIENGVILSTLQPGLATLAVYNDGRVEMKTWEEEDSTSLRNIRYARQNGVPLLEPHPVTGNVRPGKLVMDWGRGNWSGSDAKELRTLRAGACIQETGESRFLIYGYFSCATPSTMAHVFRACNCNYAMHLDMNAPEHTYLAIYRTEGSQFVVQRLVKEMAEVDPPVDGQELPRYIGYSDNRDFFYLLRKTEGPE
jgi:hypothetical protein